MRETQRERMKKRPRQNKGEGETERGTGGERVSKRGSECF